MYTVMQDFVHVIDFHLKYKHSNSYLEILVDTCMYVRKKA